MPKSASQQPPAGAPRRASYARSADTRAKILAAALAEASETGFHKTSVARIAARAGVAVGNLHYHFGSRGQLLRELMGSLMAELVERLHVAVPDPSANFFDVERAALRVYIEYLRENPAYGRLIDEIKLHEPELFAKGVAAWIELLVKRMRVEVERGNLRPMTDDELNAQAFFMLGSRHYLGHLLDMQRALGRPYPGDEVVIDAYLALTQRGLAADPRDATTKESE